MTNQQQIALTIRDQIKAGDFWCLPTCGARDFIALDATDERRGGLKFRVTITRGTKHYIIITLTHMNEYHVQRIKLVNPTCQSNL
jgi:hypothetical protein